MNATITSMFFFFFKTKFSFNMIKLHAFFAQTKAAIEWGCCLHAACFFLHAKYVCSKENMQNMFVKKKICKICYLKGKANKCIHGKQFSP